MGVDIIIFDSSSDERTNIVVSNYIFDGLKNLQYVRWQGKWDGFSLDNKVIDAYKMFGDKYEYIWIVRDGLILNSKVIKHKVFSAMSRQADFIIVNTSWRDYKKIGSKKYTDAKALFREQLMQMTILGATIVKGALVKQIIEVVPNKKGKTYGLWQPMSFFHYIDDKKVMAESIVDESFIYNVCGAKSSFWGKNTLILWCDMWCDMIDNLPNIYNMHKDSAKFIYMTDFHPFYVSNLLSIRANGGINKAEVWKCRDKIKYVCNTNPKLFNIVSAMPRCLAGFIAKSKDTSLGKVIAALYYIAFGIVPGEKEIME